MEVKTCVVKENSGIPSVLISDEFLAYELGWEFGNLVRVVAKDNTLVLQKIEDADIDYKDEFLRLFRKVSFRIDEI